VVPRLKESLGDCSGEGQREEEEDGSRLLLRPPAAGMWPWRLTTGAGQEAKKARPSLPFRAGDNYEDRVETSASIDDGPRRILVASPDRGCASVEGHERRRRPPPAALRNAGL